MLSIIASFIIIVLIFTVSYPWIILIIGIFSFLLCFLYSTSLIKMLLQLYKISLFYAAFILLYSFFYHSGKFVILPLSMKLYIEGFYKGLDVFVRGMLAAFYLFSLNFVTRRSEILNSAAHFFKHIPIILRVINIYLLSLYFLDLFLKSPKTKKIRFYHFLRKVHFCFDTMERELSSQRVHLDKFPVINKWQKLKEFFVLIFSLILLIFSIIRGEFFENLF